MLRLLTTTVFAAALLSGCATYKLGEPSETPYQSIFVAPPLNHSTVPQLEGAINSALRKAIDEAGKLRIDSRAAADAVLSLTVQNARREIAAVSESDLGRARKFEVTFDVQFSLRSTSQPDKFYFRNRPLEVTVDIFTDSGQVDAEHQAVPEIASQIAQRVAESIQDLW